jgi:4-amino-4-deoxy-L-arabinose transferase-like glycosyltransferase
MPPPESAFARRVPALALALVIALAAAVRLIGVTSDGLTSDEAFSWRIVQYPADAMVSRVIDDVHPPLYYVLLKPWLALFGDSRLALRGLSVLLSVLLVPAVFFLVCECARSAVRGEEVGAESARAGLLAALLVALHPAHVLASQNARMYSLSAVLAVASTLVLLRALRQGREFWAYGVWIAAAAYAHYYAFFTIAAQLAGGLGLALGRLRAKDRGAALATSRGLAVAGGVAVVLYAPWLPALWSQTRQVSANYWIPRVTWAGLNEALFTWLTGWERWVGAPSILVIVIVLVATTLAAARTQRTGRFLLVQAFLPWVIAVGLSVFSSRSVFLVRYLVPTQVFLLAFWASWATARKRPWARRAASLTLVALAAGCYAQAFAARATAPSAEEDAARFLAARWRPGDVFLADSPRALNRMRYYLAESGIRAPEMHCLLSSSAEETGHFVHTASLAPGEIVELQKLEVAQWPRLWFGTPAGAEAPFPAAAWQRIVIHGFTGWAGTHYTLSRYVRSPRVASARGERNSD